MQFQMLVFCFLHKHKQEREYIDHLEFKNLILQVAILLSVDDSNLQQLAVFLKQVDFPDALALTAASDLPFSKNTDLLSELEIEIKKLFFSLEKKVETEDTELPKSVDIDVGLSLICHRFPHEKNSFDDLQNEALLEFEYCVFKLRTLPQQSCPQPMSEPVLQHKKSLIASLIQKESGMPESTRYNGTKAIKACKSKPTSGG